MQLSRHVPLVDRKLILAHLLRPLELLGISLLAPALVAFLAREWIQAAVFGSLALACYGAGRRGTRSPSPVGSRDALVVAALAYLLFSLVGALAYLPSARFVDGFFESMSGFTTTGLTVVDFGSAPRSLLFFRSYSQWIGGAGIIVLSIIFLPPARATLVPLYAAEFREENVLGNIVATTRLVFAIYGTITLVAVAAFVLCGMPPFDALLHALATLSTGGFSPYPESIGRYQSAAIEIAVIVFMLAGAVSFPLYYRARREGVRRMAGDSQLRALLVIAAAAVALTAFWARGDARPVDIVFHAVSALTTTGFNVTDTASWPEGQRLLAIGLMIVGGSAGSTAGGLKLVRILVLVQVAAWCWKRAFLPAEASLPIRQGGRVLRDEEIKNVVGFTFLYLGVLAASSILLSASGCAPMDAIFEATSALGTVGLSSGLTSAELAWWAKLLLAADMWAGRLEILPLLVLLYPPQWRRPLEKSS